MFCEKCGNPIGDGVKFCEKCGAPVNAAQPEQAPVQAQAPVDQAQNMPPQGQAPVDQAQDMPPQGQAPVDQAQNMPPQGQAPVGQPQYMQQPFTQAPKPPRKPLSPKVKKIILFSGIGAVVLTVGLIILFAVIIPSANKVDVSKYITVSFDDKEVYDGDIEGYVSVSAKNLYIDKLGDEAAKKQAESADKIKSGSYSYSDFAEDLSDYSSSSGSYAKMSAISDIVSSLDIECKIKDQEESTTGDSDSYSYGAQRFQNAKKSDTLVVTIKWPTDEYERKAIDQEAQIAGLDFDMNDKTVEVKLEDKLEESKVKIKEKVELDFVSVINDKNLIVIDGTPNDYPSVHLDVFEYTEGDYTFTNMNSDSESRHDYNIVKVTNSKDSEKESKFSVSFDSVSRASAGDEIEYEINYGSEQIRDTDVFLKETKGTFKYTPNQPLTLDQAKSNVSKISEAITKDIESIDSNISKASDFSILEIDYVTSKEDTDKDPYVYLFYKNASSNKYKVIEVSHSYMRGDEFLYGSASDGWSSYDTLDKCKESVSPFSKYYADKYSTTKIQ